MKKKYTKIFIVIIIVICFFLAVFSLSKIISWYNDVNTNQELKEVLNESVTKTNDTYDVDFKNLKDKNNDTVAYLKVNGTNINYVVVQGEDNDFYLYYNFDKNSNVAGWIFATYQNKMDGTDKNIVIFGHNMRDGSMFGSLKNILKERWYNNKNNLNIKLTTEQGTFNYRVFSVYQIKVEDYYINTYFESDDEFNTFVNTLKQRSIKDFNINVNGKDNILTLSTCSDTGKERVVLHAVLVK